MMIKTMLREKVDFSKQIDGLCCHERDDAVDEASILVDQSLQHSHGLETGQLIQPLRLLQKGSDREKSDFVWS
jgi:hypothetical protein